MAQLCNRAVAPLGMGCWPIGGAMFSGDQSLGYSNSNDAESVRTIHAALNGGIQVFDTAAAYGAGHSERLLGKALGNRSEVIIATKLGIAIDESTRQLTFDLPKPDDVVPSIEASLKRLKRDAIDVVLLHQNEMPIDLAEGVFDQMEVAARAGKIKAFGWSTDFTDRTVAMAHRPGFVAIEHAMNVFFNAPKIQAATKELQLAALIRSPLAMGLLSGKYGQDSVLAKNDIRAAQQDWMEYYKDGKPNPEYLTKLDAVRELLTQGGRTLVQGALAWIWAHGDHNIPIPGARTVQQIEGIAGALLHGPLSQETIDEIESLIPRDPSEAERPR